MSKLYSVSEYIQVQATEVETPPTGFTALFADVNNQGRLSAKKDDGSHFCLEDFMDPGVTQVAAANAIAIPVSHRTVEITAGDGTTDNVISIASGAVNGQVLFIYNGDSKGTSGAVSIPAGQVAQLLYVGSAWRLTGFAQTLSSS